MRRANALIGVPILEAATHLQVGTVRDVAFGPEHDRVVGFLVEGAEQDALPFDAVTAVAADTIIIPDRSVLVNRDDDPAIRTATRSGIALNGLAVVDRNGNRIGTIDDTFLDEQTGRVVGFQVHPERHERKKLFLPLDKAVNWDTTHRRVTYLGSEAALRAEPFPAEIEAATERAA